MQPRGRFDSSGSRWYMGCSTQTRAKISVLLGVVQALLKAPDIGYTQVASSTRHRLVTSVPRHGVMSSITLNEIIPRT